MQPHQLSNWEQCQATPLWVPTIIHKTPFAIKSRLVGQKSLMEARIVTLHDITDQQGRMLDWDHHKQGELTSRYKCAYKNLCFAIDIDLIRIREADAFCQLFVSKLPIKDGARIWQFQIKWKANKAAYRFGDSLRDPQHMFVLQGGVLVCREIQLLGME